MDRGDAGVTVEVVNTDVREALARFPDGLIDGFVRTCVEVDGRSIDANGIIFSGMVSHYKETWDVFKYFSLVCSFVFLKIIK